MTFGNRWSAAIAATVVSTTLISCGEMAVRVKGRLVDAAGAPRENCLVTVEHGGQTVGEFRVSGAFDKTAVYRGSADAPLIVRGSCLEAVHPLRERSVVRPKNSVLP